MGEADRIGDTKNSNLFIKKSIDFENLFDLVGFVSVVVLRASQMFYFSILRFPKFIKNPPSKLCLPKKVGEADRNGDKQISIIQ